MSLELLTVMTIDVIGQVEKLHIRDAIPCLLFFGFKALLLIACQICHENALVIRVSIR